MTGIVSYGAYIPRYRIDRKIIYKAMGWFNPATFMPGEKAVANYDEDSVTMAVAAGMDCLKGIDRNKVDGTFFASTTFPYKERQSAQILSDAFNMRADIRTADFADSLKSGTTAVLTALDAVKAGSAENIIVCASDIRTGKAGSAQEELFGDGAASLLLGNDNVIAKVIGSYSVSYDFVDHWRADGDQYDRQWEDRFIRDVAYKQFIPEAISGALNKCGLEIKDVAKAAYPCLYAADHKGIARKLGLEETQVQEPMINNVGYTGSGNPLMLLVAALEDAKPGDKILVASFGTGSDVIIFEVTDAIEKIRGSRRGIKKNLEAKRSLESYEKMASFRNLLPLEKGIRGEEMPFTPFSKLWRIRDQVHGLIGTRCTKCGTPQFPAQKMCVNPDCEIIGQMEKYRFSDKKGTLLMYTGDNLAFSPSPPEMYGMIDFEGGGRYQFNITDTDLDVLSVGMPVEMSFRKKYVDTKFGIHGYFWKAVPVIE
ncbi:MAG: hydroxymethylglutaryl-CoA synthase family protein [Deltaproteobacteria bacterium]|nr:hydroxymethylglutaryl-CoA synthase family protein [Deltaproteobacteria bacterium]